MSGADNLKCHDEDSWLSDVDLESFTESTPRNPCLVTAEGTTRHAIKVTNHSGLPYELSFVSVCDSEHLEYPDEEEPGIWKMEKIPIRGRANRPRIRDDLRVRIVAKPGRPLASDPSVRTEIRLKAIGYPPSRPLELIIDVDVDGR